MDGSDGPIMTDGSDRTGSSLTGINNAGAISVRNHDDFAARYLPNLGHEVAGFKAFTWQLSNWKKLEKKLTSPIFECGDRRWRILLHPNGVSGILPAVVSLFLDSVEPDSPKGWHKCVQFAFAMSNKNDPLLFKESHAHHRFCTEEPDWGFTRFADPANLFNIQEGHTRPIVENDSVDITIYVRVLEDPTGVLWHNFLNYDSKKETGCVGLKNQGATGYMNTVLQTLFHNCAFRKAVYQIPTENDQPTGSIALALQRIFYHLQTSDHAISTTELTKSFGWKSLDSFLPHDVQEFYRVLHDKLEVIMKGTSSEGTIQRLFAGKMKCYIKCLHVNYEYSRVEEFSDLQLQVRGMQNIKDSLRDYIAVDTLTGRNKFQTEQFGLQEAKKGIIFQSFPLVLHLQLKRFEYDIQLDAMIKVHDRYEFPQKLDLNEFVDASADRSSPWVYTLFALMVHSGNLHGGKYYALVKPNNNTRWLKFDDDRVTPVTDKEVFEDNYGGLTQRVNPRDKDWSTNAYVLVYIREPAISEILAPIPEANIPSHIKQRLDEERRQEEVKKLENEAKKYSLTVKVVTDETFSRHQGFDLANFEDKKLPLSDLPTFQVLKEEKYANFKTRLARHFNYPEGQIRLWALVNRQNTTVRLDMVIPEDNSTTLENIRVTFAARKDFLRLFLETLTSPSLTQHPPQPILVFLKHFDTSKQTLLGAGHICVSRQGSVAELVPLINKWMGWPSSTSLKLYEEIKPGMIEQMKTKWTFGQSEITDGDVICFQVDLPEKERRNLESQGLYSDPIQFYDFLDNRVMITFQPKFEEQGNESELSLMLSKKQKYDTMSAKVGEHLRHDPVKLRFTSTDANGQPKAILKASLNPSIAEFTASTFDSVPVILYEKLDVSLDLLEAKLNLKVVWTGSNNQEIATHSFLLLRTNTLHELEKHLLKKVKLSRGGTQKIRFFEISIDGKQGEFAGTMQVGKIPATTEIYAEEIPREETEAKGTDILVDVFHFSKEISRTHGVPFRFVVKLGEKFLDTKRRLQARMGIPDAQITSYRFAIQVSNFRQPLYIDDDDIIYHAQFTPVALGLDHIDKSGKPRAGVHPLVILS